MKKFLYNMYMSLNAPKALKPTVSSLHKKIQSEGRCDMAYFLKNGKILIEYAELERAKPSKIPSDGLQKLKKKSPSSTSGSDHLYNKYRFNIDNTYICPNPTFRSDDDYCKGCKSYRCVDQDEAKAVCMVCGECVYIQIEAKPEYEVGLVSSNYRRYLHFCEHLKKLQGMEGTTIPKGVIDVVRSGMEKEKVRADTLTIAHIKRYLKAYKMQKFYGHSVQILGLVTGKATLRIDPCVEEELKELFKQVQEPFELYRGDRRNMASYEYITFKLMELINYTDINSYIKITRNKETLRENDQIWKKICDHLGWKFIKTA